VAYVCREFEVPGGDVFAVLVDPMSYPHWLIGTEAIRDVDDSWPAPGTRFHHRVGVGPFAIPDHTEVMAMEQSRLLQLRVWARPLITAIVTFRVLGEGTRCVVTMEEEPARRALGNLVRPIMDPVIHVRNHRSLRRLDAVVAERQRTR
jgi:uncharacterized protein YndB with AHSA1/START domain